MSMNFLNFIFYIYFSHVDINENLKIWIGNVIVQYSQITA